MKRFAVVVAFLLAPSLAAAQKVSFDFDKSANFNGLKTYTLKDGTPAKDNLLDQRIVSAIKEQLNAKGLVESTTAPDVVVRYHVAVDTEKDISAWSTGYGGGPYGYHWGGGWGTTDVRVNTIYLGTLVIDMADPKDDVIWRGIATKEIDPQAKSEKRDKKVKEAVQKVLKNYPPKAKKET